MYRVTLSGYAGFIGTAMALSTPVQIAAEETLNAERRKALRELDADEGTECPLDMRTDRRGHGLAAETTNPSDNMMAQKKPKKKLSGGCPPAPATNTPNCKPPLLSLQMMLKPPSTSSSTPQAQEESSNEIAGRSAGSKSAVLHTIDVNRRRSSSGARSVYLLQILPDTTHMPVKLTEFVNKVYLVWVHACFGAC